MSDAQPDREKTSAAEEASRSPWVSWIVWLILAPGMYLLSVGPVVWLVSKGYLSESVGAVYAPVSYLPESFVELWSRYAAWWWQR